MPLGKGLSSLIPQHPKKVSPTEIDVPITRESKGDSRDRIWHIPLSEIVPNSEQPRKYFSEKEMMDLVASIKEHGIMQPIVVTELEDGGYEIIAGERRFRASQLAGNPTIPAIVKNVTAQEKLELALIENIQRQDLNPIEEAFAYRRLIEQFGLRQQEVADRVGKSRPAVANTIRLLDLPEEIQTALIDGRLSEGKARAILSLRRESDQLAMFASMMGQNMTVRDVEQQVAARGPISRKGIIRKDPNLISQEQLLEDRLKTKVHITQKGGRGTIVVEYFTKEELMRLIEELS